jgi:hypothetical protein
MIKNTSLSQDLVDSPLFVGVLDGHVLILSTANPVMTADAARETAGRLIEAADQVGHPLTVVNDELWQPLLVSN